VPGLENLVVLVEDANGLWASLPGEAVPVADEGVAPGVMAVKPRKVPCVDPDDAAEALEPTLVTELVETCRPAVEILGGGDLRPVRKVAAEGFAYMEVALGTPAVVVDRAGVTGSLEDAAP
jgi:hypothetical protein